VFPTEPIFVCSRNISAEFSISVFVEGSEHDRQLLGSTEMDFRDIKGNKYGMNHSHDRSNLLKYS
jgi:hypothetical protein